MYKHSNGKENLRDDEISKLKLLCDEYAKRSLIFLKTEAFFMGKKLI
ncbi:MAG: hypothetical protein L6U99_09435 [Clostridium sp.]|nr:MAG: hypothetical protein L6U99_09435 [Clostridium sp.]